MANRPKRKTQAIMATSMTFFIPSLFMKNGIRSMHKVSDACDIASSALEFLTANAFAYSGYVPKEPRKVLA